MRRLSEKQIKKNFIKPLFRKENICNEIIHDNEISYEVPNSKYSDKLQNSQRTEQVSFRGLQLASVCLQPESKKKWTKPWWIVKAIEYSLSCKCLYSDILL